MTSLRGPLLSQLFIYSFISSLLKMFHSFASWSRFSSSSFAVGDPSRRRMTTEATVQALPLLYIMWSLMSYFHSHLTILSCHSSSDSIIVHVFFFSCFFCQFPSAPLSPHLLMSIAFFSPTLHLVLLPPSTLRYTVPIKGVKRCVVHTGHYSTQNAKVHRISWMLKKSSVQIS